MRNCILIGLLVAMPGAFADFHVAANGGDKGPGTAEAPFATLNRARIAVLATKPTHGATVWVHGGTYEFDEPLLFGAGDSGAPGAPVVYRAVQGEKVRLLGGRRIPPDAFAPVTDEGALARLPEEVRTAVMACDLALLGVGDIPAFPDAFLDPPMVPELFFNGDRMTLARWPNDEWATIAEVIESGPAPWRNHASDQPGTFRYEGDRPARWATAPAVWLHGYWCFDWCSETIRAARVDPENARITFVKPHGYGIGNGNPAPRRYYAENLLEELDKPGEYYLDPASKRLYFLPPGAIDDAEILLSVLTEPVIRLEGASHVVLRGLTVEAAAGDAVQVSGGEDVRIEACSVRNTGHAGVVVSGGKDHRVTACDISDTGTAGLIIGGGDRATLAPSGHEAVNNHIYRIGRRKRTHAYNVHISGVGVRLAHNLIHDAPHQAIGLSGNGHIIEYNEIHHSGQASDDCGAFYMGRNPSERGNVLRYNYWHDIGSTFAHGSCAVYFDDGDGGQTVYGNVFYRAVGGNFGAVFVHGGHDNVVKNCVFIECRRALGHAPWDDARWQEWLDGDLWQERLLKEVDITSPLYLERYPDLEDYFDGDARPRVNIGRRNVLYKCGELSNGNWSLENNLTTDEDPGFIDAANMNFGFEEGAKVFEAVPGFEPIPFDKIGLYTDELRPEGE